MFILGLKEKLEPVYVKYVKHVSDFKLFFVRKMLAQTILRNRLKAYNKNYKKHK